MKLFSHQRYKINILVLRLLGQWPLQPKIENIIVTTFWMLTIISLLVPQIHKCIIEPTEEIIMTNIPPLITVTVSIMKVCNGVIMIKKVKRLLSLMQDEWTNVKFGSDYEIMLKYANDGYKYVIIYVFLFYNSMVVFLSMPLRPKVMVWLGLAEGPAEIAFPYPTDYWVDSDKYFFLIEAHICFGTTLVMTAVMAPDALFIVFVQHACSMFAVICNKLENIPIESLTNVELYVNKEQDKAFEIISECVQLHNRALEFSILLDDAYTWGFFFGVGLNTMLLTFSGVQIVTHLDDIEEVIRYAPFCFGQVFHIFVESTISQQLMDHCETVDTSIIMMKWYALSLRSQKLLNLITIRSRVICYITAGKMFTLSVEFFCTVLKTAMSYFTLLRSMQVEEN